MRTIENTPSTLSAIRPGEVAVPVPETGDALVYFIGRIRTPWKSRAECPKRGDPVGGPVCTVEVDELWREGLAGVDRHEWLELLYWMHQARRDLVLQSPKSDGQTTGTFALRSPVRPNPIASSMVRLVRMDGPNPLVRGLDCIDGTPLIDIKPERGRPATSGVQPS